MDWVLSHLPTIIAIAGGVAWWLKQRKESPTGGGAAPSSPQEKTFEDPELAERTRRIREEIQRKIEQRARGYAHEQPKPLPPEPAAPPPVRQVVVTPVEPPRIPAGMSKQEAQRSAEILEQQKALMEKLQEATLMKTAAEKRVLFEAATADHMAERRTETQTSVMGELRTPEALRRAFILREVLGPPVALRR